MQTNGVSGGTYRKVHCRVAAINRSKAEFNFSYLRTQSVPRSKHCVSLIKTSQLMLYREIMAVCSEIHTKHINTLCRQNVELLHVKLAVHIVTTGL